MVTILAYMIAGQEDKALGWARHDHNIYGKILHCFAIIGKVLNDPAITSDKFHNMDETGDLLSVQTLIHDLLFSFVDVHAVPVTKTFRCISSASLYLPFLISTSPKSLMADRVLGLFLPKSSVDNFTTS